MPPGGGGYEESFRPEPYLTERFTGSCSDRIAFPAGRLLSVYMRGTRWTGGRTMDSLAYKSQPGRMYHFIHLMSCQIPTKRFRAVLRMTLGSNRAGKSHDTERKSRKRDAGLKRYSRRKLGRVTHRRVDLKQCHETRQHIISAAYRIALNNEDWRA